MLFVCVSYSRRYMTVLTLSSSGLLVSWIMKYADSIVKVYATSMAMLVTMVVSIFLFGQTPTLQVPFDASSYPVFSTLGPPRPPLTLSSFALRSEKTRRLSKEATK